MSCLTAEGKPSGVACGMLRLLRRPANPHKVSLCLGLPLREVREDLGELAAAGYVIREKGFYRTTASGRGIACAPPEVDPVC